MCGIDYQYMELQFVQLAKLYNWNGTPAASVTDALSEAGLREVNALYFSERVSTWRVRLFAVGTEDPIDSHRSIRRVYSDQRRITFPTNLIVSNLSARPEHLEEQDIVLRVYAADGVLGFKLFEPTNWSIRDRFSKKLKDEVSIELSSNCLTD